MLIGFFDDSDGFVSGVQVDQVRSHGSGCYDVVPQYPTYLQKLNMNLINLILPATRPIRRGFIWVNLYQVVYQVVYQVAYPPDTKRVWSLND